MPKTNFEGDRREYYKDIVSRLEHTWQRLRAKKELMVYLCSCPKLSKISYPQIAVIH